MPVPSLRRPCHRVEGGSRQDHERQPDPQHVVEAPVRPIGKPRAADRAPQDQHEREREPHDRGDTELPEHEPSMARGLPATLATMASDFAGDYAADLDLVRSAATLRGVSKERRTDERVQTS